ncbi:MAG: MoxR family ATPase [Pseudomonadota bacterium]|nr:MoxR family ATPase [Pseudomonadota bacterium]
MDRDLIARIDHTGDILGRARDSLGQVIFGQKDVVDLSLVALLSGGHTLLIGVPGLAKTLLVSALGAVLGLDARRIQCTPDLMPADILGSEVLEEGADGRRAFRFIAGPVFCQLLMADEINRASPRTQSALLQAMQERHVAVAGVDRALPSPFHVLATQNPLEQEGTYPLPEAQLDRFLLQIDVDYPDLATERKIMIETTGAALAVAEPVTDGLGLMDMQDLVRRLPVTEGVIDGILKLVRRGRPDQTDLELVRRHVVWGPGPRACQALMLTARARALMDGRDAPSLDDVIALAPAVLSHRMALSYAARAEGVTLADVIDALIEPLR